MFATSCSKLSFAVAAAAAAAMLAVLGGIASVGAATSDGAADATGNVLPAQSAGRWIPMLSPTTEDLHSVDVVDVEGEGLQGWAVGESGTILKLVRLEPGGLTFKAVRSPTTATLRAVAVASDGRAFAAGAAGTFLEQRNGAWRRQPGPRIGGNYVGIAATTQGVWLATAARSSSGSGARFRGELWERMGKGSWEQVLTLERESFADMDASPDEETVLAVGGSSTVGHEGWVAVERRDGEWHERRGFSIGSRPMNAAAYGFEGGWWAAGASRFWIGGREQDAPESWFSAVAPLGRGVGWLGDLHGQIWRYRRAEELWEIMLTPSDHEVTDIVVPTPNLSFAVGTNGFLMIWQRARGADPEPIYLPVAVLQ